MGAFILVFGYCLALPIIVRIRQVFRERRVRWFLALEVATVLVIVGYVLLGRPAPAAINVVGGLLLGYTWWAVGRRAAAAS